MKNFYLFFFIITPKRGTARHNIPLFLSLDTNSRPGSVLCKIRSKVELEVPPSRCAIYRRYPLRDEMGENGEAKRSDNTSSLPSIYNRVGTFLNSLIFTRPIPESLLVENLTATLKGIINPQIFWYFKHKIASPKYCGEKTDHHILEATTDSRMMVLFRQTQRESACHRSNTRPVILEKRDL